MGLNFNNEQNILEKTNNTDCLIPAKNPLAAPLKRISKTFKSITDEISNISVNTNLSKAATNFIKQVTNSELDIDNLVKLPKVDLCKIDVLNKANDSILKNLTINKLVKDTIKSTTGLTGIPTSLDNITKTVRDTLLEAAKRNILKDKLSFLKEAISDCPNKNLSNTNIGKNALTNSMVKQAAECNDTNIINKLADMVDNKVLDSNIVKSVISYSDELTISATGTILGKKNASRLAKNNSKLISRLLSKTTKRTIHKTIAPKDANMFKDIVNDSKTVSYSKKGDFFHKVLTTIAKNGTVKPNFKDGLKPIENDSKYNLAVVG